MSALAVSCHCLNVRLTLADAPRTDFLLQDGASSGYAATLVNGSITIEHPMLTAIRDLDHCQLKWLYCGNCSVEVYGVENDEEQAHVLVPLDGQIVVTPHALTGDAVTALEMNKQYSSLFRILLQRRLEDTGHLSTTMTAESYQLNAELQKARALVDTTLNHYITARTTETNERIERFRQEQLDQLVQITNKVADERDILFAAIERFEQAQAVLLAKATDTHSRVNSASMTGTVASTVSARGYLPTSMSGSYRAAQSDMERFHSLTLQEALPAQLSTTIELQENHQPRRYSSSVHPSTTKHTHVYRSEAIDIFELDDNDQPCNVSEKEDSRSIDSRSISTSGSNKHEDDNRAAGIVPSPVHISATSAITTASSMLAASLPVSVPRLGQAGSILNSGHHVDQTTTIPPHEYFARTYQAGDGFVVGSRPDEKRYNNKE